jgi:hypothetical protein
MSTPKLISQIDEIMPGDSVLRPNATGEPSEVVVVRILQSRQNRAVIVWAWSKEDRRGVARDVFLLKDGQWIFSESLDKTGQS